MSRAKPVDQKLAAAAQQELARYRRQQHLRLIRTIATSSVMAMVFLVVFGLAIGGAFEGFLGLLGLTPFENEARGIYTDCSLPQNKDARYCQSQSKRSYENDWRQVSHSGQGSAKFRLTD